MHVYSEGCTRLLAEIGSVRSLCVVGMYAPLRVMIFRSFFAAHIGGWMLALAFLYECVELEGSGRHMYNLTITTVGTILVRWRNTSQRNDSRNCKVFTLHVCKHMGP